ncbi:MAG: hypothetical protein KGJ09_03555 [Candidatus Omnitrophica bacterium]|nr:hypothetical protein [Candidatus Omnitrophota bacterium]
MCLPEPPKWKEDAITKFIGDVQHNAYVTFVKYSTEFSRLIEVDSLFREAIGCTNNAKFWFACLFPLKAHSAFLSAVQLIMGTQAQESYMVMRGTIENALYGYYIFKHKELAEVYLKRDENLQTKREMKKRFQNKAIIEELKADEMSLGSAVEILYERVIDFGAHPNEKSLSSALKRTDLKDGVRFDVSYLTDNPKVIELGLKTVTQVGIACVKIIELQFPERFKIVGLSDKIQSISRFF